MEPRKRKPKSKNYFTHDTELAILRYTKELDSDVRSKIYREELEYAFFKLTENIIHSFKLRNTEETNLEHLQHEVIVFLISKFHLFDPTKGAKAYSYFGTIAKRYLIALNKKHYSKTVKVLPLETIKGNEGYLESLDSRLLDNNLELGIQDQYLHPVDELSDFMDQYVAFYTPKLTEIFVVSEDLEIAYAIMKIFKSRDKLEILNKKALYLYIREQVNVKTTKITKVSKILGDYFQKHYLEYLENGFTEFKI